MGPPWKMGKIQSGPSSCTPHSMLIKLRITMAEISLSSVQKVVHNLMDHPVTLKEHEIEENSYSIWTEISPYPVLLVLREEGGKGGEEETIEVNALRVTKPQNRNIDLSISQSHPGLIVVVVIVIWRLSAKKA